jgi:hypothetical protein
MIFIDGTILEHKIQTFLVLFKNLKIKVYWKVITLPEWNNIEFEYVRGSVKRFINP